MIKMIDNFKEINKEIDVIVEAAHIYTSKKPGKEQEYSAEIGSQICEIISNLGFNVYKWVLIDDYNPKIEGTHDPNFDIKKYLDIISNKGFNPDVIKFESSLVKDAKAALEGMIKSYHAYKGEGVVKLSKSVGYEKHVIYNCNSEHYSCSLLDASLYIEKAKHADMMITVLPESYKSQQKLTMTIATKIAKVGLDMDSKVILPVYFKEPKYEHLGPSIILPEKEVPVISPAIGMLSKSDEMKIQLYEMHKKVV